MASTSDHQLHHHHHHHNIDHEHIDDSHMQIDGPQESSSLSGAAAAAAAAAAVAAASASNHDPQGAEAAADDEQGAGNHLFHTSADGEQEYAAEHHSEAGPSQTQDAEGLGAHGSSEASVSAMAAAAAAAAAAAVANNNPGPASVQPQPHFSSAPVSNSGASPSSSALPPASSAAPGSIPFDTNAFDDTPQHSLSHHQHSLQDGRQKDSPYSRTPELKVSHKLAERKRRKEMKDLFEDLRDQLPVERGPKTSKWEILSKATEHIQTLTRQRDELFRELTAFRANISSSLQASHTTSALPAPPPLPLPDTAAQNKTPTPSGAVGVAATTPAPADTSLVSGPTGNTSTGSVDSPAPPAAASLQPPTAFSPSAPSSSAAFSNTPPPRALGHGPDPISNFVAITGGTSPGAGSSSARGGRRRRA
ncbi:hypothetical protein OC861_002330 [Tilletia horrida]|nr:hypothetical protein OC861_002330 [Tilletia horrida]